MGSVRYKPSAAAKRKILNSPACVAMVDQHAQRVKAAADAMGGATYAADTRPGRVRAHGIVYTPSEHAIRSNAKHNTLLKALYGGR